MQGLKRSGQAPEWDNIQASMDAYMAANNYTTLPAGEELDGAGDTSTNDFSESTGTLDLETGAFMRGATTGYFYCEVTILCLSSRPLLPHALRPEDDQDGQGDGDYYGSQANDYRGGAQTENRVDLVFDPLQENGVARLGVVRQDRKQQHGTPSLAAVSGWNGSGRGGRRRRLIAAGELLLADAPADQAGAYKHGSRDSEGHLIAAGEVVQHPAHEYTERATHLVCEGGQAVKSAHRPQAVYVCR